MCLRAGFGLARDVVATRDWCPKGDYLCTKWDSGDCDVQQSTRICPDFIWRANCDMPSREMPWCCFVFFASAGNCGIGAADPVPRTEAS